MKNYLVTLRYQHPAWDERDGLTYTVEAEGKAQAIRRARRQAEADGNAGTGLNRGRQTWSAVETDECARSWDPFEV